MEIEDIRNKKLGKGSLKTLLPNSAKLYFQAKNIRPKQDEI